MPAFTALATVTAFTAASLTTAAGAAGFTLSAAAATAGANLIIGGTLSVLSQLAFAQKPPGMGGGAMKTVINQADAYRTRGYGRAKLGGVRATLRSRKGRLYQVILVHHGEIHRFADIYFGDLRLTLNSDGAATNEEVRHNGNFYVDIQTRRGSDDSPAYQMLVDNLTDWTTAHKINGVATVMARFRSINQKRFNKIFPQGAATPITAVCELSEVYDPRVQTTRYTPNSALCTRDYMRNADGFRLPRELVGSASWARMADRCDEPIRRRNGTTEPRYALGGVYSLNDQPKDALSRMLATCDGELFTDADGKIGIRGGAWSEPTVTLDYDKGHIKQHSLTQGNDRYAAFNKLVVTYIAPGQDYKTAELVAWEDLESQAIIGVKEQTLPLDMVQSASQAKRLGRIYAAKQNPRWMGTISTTLYGLLAYGASDDNPDNGRIIRVKLPELDIDETFWVEQCGIRGDLTGCEFTIRSLGPEAYGHNEADDPEDPAALPDHPDVEDIPVPTGLTLSLSSSKRLSVTVDDPDFDGLELEAQWQTPAEFWDQMTTLTGSPLTATANVGSANPPIEVRARWLTPNGDAGDWSEHATLTA